MQLDAAFGAVNAVQEMLFHWQKGELSVLPALPRRLAAGRARGLVFPDGAIDLRWEKDGTVEITVSAIREVDAALLLAGVNRGRICLQPGQAETVRLSV